MFGEKVTLKEEKLSVHYFCLLTSCGVYQRGEEDEGVFGFLLEDIRQEIRRSARLTCSCCKKKGACVGCNVRSCRKMFHFPCGRKSKYISQFTGLFPSYCPDHSPTQSLCVSSDLSLPQSCSICLDSIEPVLSYSILKCPSCHSSWFHRDCVQRQAHSAGLFFFRCTLCNNKETFQEEMQRMGIYIPERDASWELEENAYSELLEVYMHCDALTCLCTHGRTHSAKTGWFEVIRCRLCGSRGTHRRCSELKLDTRDWACSDCTQATDGKGRICWFLTVYSRAERLIAFSIISRYVKTRFPNRKANQSFFICLFSSSPSRFKGGQQTTFPSSLQGSDAARKYFLKLLVQQIQDSVVFEGPDGSKNLALDSQALRDDLYFDVGCLLALCLVHGGPPVVGRVSRTRSSLDALREVMAESWEFLELAGCNRPISSLQQREALLEDLVGFTMITRMQLPLQRFREGLQTLGVFDQVQLFPSAFCAVFCEAAGRLSAQTLAHVFTVKFSEQEERLSRETPVLGYWRHFLLECEVGRSSISLQDLLRFSTGAEDLLATAALLSPPSISFLHPPQGLFPQRDPGSRRLLLPVSSTYRAFKSSMEQAVSHHAHLLPTHS
uniref:G2/M-phase specific E3 ubiquitin protein ligase n=1 Tax=Sander lucioperca TaxID=283035 RepID=A0A8C9ZI71_SANLU